MHAITGSYPTSVTPSYLPPTHKPYSCNRTLALYNTPSTKILYTHLNSKRVVPDQACQNRRPAPGNETGGAQYQRRNRRDPIKHIVEHADENGCAARHRRGVDQQLLPVESARVERAPPHALGDVQPQHAQVQKNHDRQARPDGQ